MKTPFVCVCGHDRFVNSRKIALVKLADGSMSRDWGSSDTDAKELICAKCARRYIWNAKTGNYDPDGIVQS